MSDKERSASHDNESFDERLRIEEVKLGGVDVSGVENPEADRSVDQVRERASDASSPQSDEGVIDTPEGGKEAARTDATGQGSAESKRSLVAELASHLGKPRSDFHNSKQVISYCRKRFRGARF